MWRADSFGRWHGELYRTLGGKQRRMLGKSNCVVPRAPRASMKDKVCTACQGMHAPGDKGTVSHTHTCPATQHHTLYEARRDRQEM